MKNSVVIIIVFGALLLTLICVLMGCGMDPANATYPWTPTHPVHIQKDAGPDVSINSIDASGKDQ